MIILYHLRLRIQNTAELQKHLESVDLSKMDDFKEIYDISRDVYAKVLETGELRCVYNLNN